ncbi:RICIN domain-containing protein [Kitasatospora cineracea]|uniref:Ricin-type beta-trefoil lectin protein n=1 Tax=Kitasatospora cineracea TaxID=88074 RepID=A0A3N4R4R0_9ACTN|nr:RICIN domain-containing protein [Kitasatospora cineracea]RPE28553.1 ricin-type beta-trefoil lectin protein [Kitasatospora cineracea]
MSRTRSALLCALLALGAPLAAGTTPAQAAPVPVVNGTQFTDTTGAGVQAHGGGVIKVGAYYYWFGEDRNADNSFRYVSVYRSTDLKTWEFRNHVLTQATDPELASANIERPKVIYNRATGQFVMWMHKESATDYGEARAAVAVSSTVDGNYSWRGSFRPLGEMSRDITTFVDDDGTAYMVSAANENRDLHVYRLTADYTGIDAQVQSLWNGSSREAPALFKRGGVYFLLTSGATGWTPNQQMYGTATSVTGSWSGLTNIGDGLTYGSQTAYVLPVQGTSGTGYLYMGDRWGNWTGGTVNDSQYVWLPLTFPTATSMTMGDSPQITVDTAAGTVAPMNATWENLTGQQSGKCVDVADYAFTAGAQTVQWSCGWGANQTFWFKPLSGGYVQITARHSGKCLDIAGNSTANGAAVVQNTCSTANSQQWQVQKADSSGNVRLVDRRSGKCLDVTNQSTADGTALEQWTCNTGTNQLWRRGPSWL